MYMYYIYLFGNSVVTVIMSSQDYILKYMICHHQASFFIVNSVVTVIMSSEDYILNIYDMIINKHHFHFIKFKTRRFFKLMLILKSKTRKHIQDDVKAKLQDKEVRPKTICKCQGQNPR